MFARYRAMNYIRDHKREVPLAEITMSEDRYPNSLIDDSSEDQVVALLKEKCFRELGIDIFQELYQNRETYIQTMKNSPQQNSIDTIIDLIEAAARH